MYQTIELTLQDQVMTVWLNRPEVHNAFNALLIEELHQACLHIHQRDDVRVVILASRGKSFSAGADLAWMQTLGNATLAENQADALKLAHMLKALATLRQPTIARIQGAALGGGLGLVAACDMAVASQTAIFATSEVRLGLIPATIAPYVIRAIGERQAYRYFQTAERFDAATAYRLGLVHDVATPETLDEVIGQLVTQLLLGGPASQTESKALIRDIGHTLLSQERLTDTARRIAERRASAEGQEGLAAFLEKRPPAWVITQEQTANKT
ncbi:enoyl-CoA hydratase/isomerase family protein [Leeia oryzae]|uniref:enoyl-CoA hydratase/isomerase family protein n=1 Tax=Leeia oryzae TaxID=356662 RepID=UPI000376BA84|nr:enoyl-CoA hydratase/isomerase family protein [Leeia oryzae]